MTAPAEAAPVHVAGACVFRAVREYPAVYRAPGQETGQKTAIMAALPPVVFSGIAGASPEDAA